MGFPNKTRILHFYVAISKYLYMHAKYGIVHAIDPIGTSEAAKYDLKPVFLYGMTVPTLPIRWFSYTPADAPRSLEDFLLDGLTKGKGLRGRPDILLVSKGLALASPVFIENMARIGIHVQTAGPKEKSLYASEVAAQKLSIRSFPCHLERTELPVPSLDDLCKTACENHNYQIQSDSGFSSEGPVIRERIKSWLSLPMRPVELGASKVMDWTAGPWLSSWENALPPERERFFQTSGNQVILRTGNERDYFGEDGEELGEDDEFEYGDDFVSDNVAELTQWIIQSSNHTAAQFAKHIGIGTKELNWFIAGKYNLPDKKRRVLLRFLGLSMNDYEYEVSQPYVFIANKMAAIAGLYNNISHGGDDSPLEIIPANGPADPSWRYAIFNVEFYSSIVVMFPRGEKITDRMEEILFNFRGEYKVKPDFFNKLVAACAKACSSPERNIPTMTKFSQANQLTLDALFEYKDRLF